MSRCEREQVLFRIERGHANEQEIAALALVLLALREGAAEPESERSFAGSHWWRRDAGYRAPDGWQ